MPPNSGIDAKFKKRFERERQARKAAERLIEAKSRELYFANQSLQETHQVLKEKSDHLNKVNLKLNEEIKEREKTQQALAVAVEEALELSRLKTEFLTNMSHEFRTPLNGIIGLSQLLLLTTLDNEQLDYLTEINSSGESLLSIMEDVLAFASLETESFELNNAPFSLFPLLEALKVDCKNKASDKGLGLNFKIGSGVPKELIGDAALLNKILKSLLNNGIKFTDSGRVELTVVVTAQSDESVQLHFTIQDTGIGISDNQFEHIFKSFSQADSTLTRQYEGAGLGLTLSKQFVELMGGKIKIESSIGQGSIFHVQIPFKVAKKQGHAKQEFADIEFNILLVDDNKINQRVAANLFKRIGCQLTIANDGLEALELLQKDCFDVVFLDTQMPGLNGEEVAKRIHTELAGSRPWIITMFNKGENMIDANVFKANDTIDKPMNRKAVVEALKKSKLAQSKA